MSSRPPAHRHRHPTRQWRPIAAGALACYLASYAAFSSWGQYVTPADHPRPVWAPGEFYDFTDRRWRKSHTLIYSPLLWLDHRFWHPPHRAPSPP